MVKTFYLFSSQNQLRCPIIYSSSSSHTWATTGSSPCPMLIVLYFRLPSAQQDSVIQKIKTKKMKGGSSNSNCNKQQHHHQHRPSSMAEANYNQSSIEYNPNPRAPSPGLSGAYIRTLVKHLTTTSTAVVSTTNATSKTKSKGTNSNISNNTTCMAERGGDGASPQPQVPRKKQVRRRLHTSRPYQERLLNMAEARKEIVAALKFHRASMKQQQQQQQPQQPPPREMTAISSPLNQQEDPDHRFLMSMNNNYSPYSSYLENNTHSNSLNNWSYDPPQYGYHCPWPLEPSPSQSLGLNLSLNFQDLNNLDPHFINLLHQTELSTSTSPSPSSPSSSSPPPPPPISFPTGYVDAGGIRGGDGDVESLGGGGGGLYLHQALDEEELEEIRSVGEQHQMEWSDTLNLVTSAWWSNFLSKMDFELGSQGNQQHSNSTNNQSSSNDCFSSGSDDFSHAAAHW